jgi:ABC-type sugar transport system substrate-binding protein
MDHHVGAMATGAEGTAGGDVNFFLELAGGNLGAQFLQDLFGSSGGAAAVIVGLAVGADENMVAKRQHRVLLIQS